MGNEYLLVTLDRILERSVVRTENGKIRTGLVDPITGKLTSRYYNSLNDDKFALHGTIEDTCLEKMLELYVEQSSSKPLDPISISRIMTIREYLDKHRYVLDKPLDLGLAKYDKLPLELLLCINMDGEIELCKLNTDLEPVEILKILIRYWCYKMTQIRENSFYKQAPLLVHDRMSIRLYSNWTVDKVEINSLEVIYKWKLYRYDFEGDRTVGRFIDDSNVYSDRHYGRWIVQRIFEIIDTWALADLDTCRKWNNIMGTCGEMYRNYETTLLRNRKLLERVECIRNLVKKLMQ